MKFNHTGMAVASFTSAESVRLQVRGSKSWSSGRASSLYHHDGLALALEVDPGLTVDWDVEGLWAPIVLGFAHILIYCHDCLGHEHQFSLRTWRSQSPNIPSRLWFICRLVAALGSGSSCQVKVQGQSDVDRVNSSLVFKGQSGFILSLGGIHKCFLGSDFVMQRSSGCNLSQTQCRALNIASQIGHHHALLSQTGQCHVHSQGFSPTLAWFALFGKSDTQGSIYANCFPQNRFSTAKIDCSQFRSDQLLFYFWIKFFFWWFGQTICANCVMAFGYCVHLHGRCNILVILVRVDFLVHSDAILKTGANPMVKCLPIQCFWHKYFSAIFISFSSKPQQSWSMNVEVYSAIWRNSQMKNHLIDPDSNLAMPMGTAECIWPSPVFACFG